MKAKITFICMLFACMSFAQAQNYKPMNMIQYEKSIGTEFSDHEVFKIAENRSLTLPPELTHYTLLSIDADKLTSITSNRNKAISLTIPSVDRGSMILDLVLVNQKTPDFEVKEMPQGNVLNSNVENKHYRGVIQGVPNSIASLSIIDGEIMGLISRPDHAGNFVIGKLDNSDLHILYADVDIKDAQSYSCESINAQGEMRDYAEEILFADANNKAAGDCPRIYFDLSTSFLATQGNNSTTASNYVEGVFNQVATLYANENVNILNSGMTVWTSNQPFSTDLANYRNYRNANSFNGDLGHLISTLGGGVAYINGLCSSYKYGESGLTGSYQTVPTYSWSVNLLAHELGHNFGSRHTHDCAWNGNNTAIDGCGPAAGYSSGCNGPIPSGGGTIMSYCHLVSVGVNLGLGFGSQPGNVIRNTVLSSNCTTSCNSGGTGCAGAPQWQAGVTYNFGDQVIYENYLYEYTSSGWLNLGLCGSTDICANVPAWEPISYPIGAYVTYQGNLYQWTSSGWVLIGACGTTGGSFAAAAPGNEAVSIALYPNPVNGDVLKIDITNGMIQSYRILNHLGQLVQSADTNLGAINVSKIQEGIYVIEVSTVNGEQFVERFVKY